MAYYVDQINDPFSTLPHVVQIQPQIYSPKIRRPKTLFISHHHLWLSNPPFFLISLATASGTSQMFARLSLPTVQETNRLDPWVGKILWRRKWQPTPVLLPGKSHGWRSMVGYSPWGCKELDMTELLHLVLVFAIKAELVRMDQKDGFGSFVLVILTLQLESHLIWCNIWKADNYILLISGLLMFLRLLENLLYPSVLLHQVHPQYSCGNE